MLQILFMTIDGDQPVSLASEIWTGGKTAHGKNFMRRRSSAAITPIRRRTQEVISTCPAIQPDFRT